MKRDLIRRIEALEIKQSARAHDRKAIAERALGSLFWIEERVQFLSALGAERVSREFTDAELAAKEKYLRALKQETRLAGYSSFAGFEYAFDLNCLVIRSLSRITDDDLRLMIRAGRAAEEGQEATPEESAAVAKYIAEKTKCVHLAFGLLSAADLKEDPCQ